MCYIWAFSTIRSDSTVWTGSDTYALTHLLYAVTCLSLVYYFNHHDSSFTKNNGARPHAVLPLWWKSLLA